MDESIDKFERAKLFSLFENLKDVTIDTGLNLSQNDNVMLVDGLNTFIRSFLAIPSMNADGLHIGGIAGFLKSLGYAIKLLNITRCVLIFDGPGGSYKRKKIYPEYKNHRKFKLKLNRMYDNFLSVDEEEKNMQLQFKRLFNYIDILPVNLVIIDNVEADDVISYCALDYFKNSKKTYIMSSDKDFLQLINDRINVWSPTKKKLYGISELITEYGLHPNNYLIFKILDGDKSDNIHGVLRCGIKTVIKAFPFLIEEKKVGIDDIYDYSNKNVNKLKLYESILNSRTIIQRNYDLMQLFDTNISSTSQLEIHRNLDKKLNKLNKIEFSKMIINDKMMDNIPNSISWVGEVFDKINSFVH